VAATPSKAVEIFRLLVVALSADIGVDIDRDIAGSFAVLMPGVGCSKAMAANVVDSLCPLPFTRTVTNSHWRAMTEIRKR
jgi:hypothetical protein